MILVPASYESSSHQNGVSLQLNVNGVVDTEVQDSLDDHSGQFGNGLVHDDVLVWTQKMEDIE